MDCESAVLAMTRFPPWTGPLVAPLFPPDFPPDEQPAKTMRAPAETSAFLMVNRCVTESSLLPTAGVPADPTAEVPADLTASRAARHDITQSRAARRHRGSRFPFAAHAACAAHAWANLCSALMLRGSGEL